MQSEKLDLHRSDHQSQTSPLVSESQPNYTALFINVKERPLPC